jgi:hypothetical protein
MCVAVLPLLNDILVYLCLNKMNKPGKRELTLLLKRHTCRTQGVSNQSCFFNIMCVSQKGSKFRCEILSVMTVKSMWS